MSCSSTVSCDISICKFCKEDLSRWSSERQVLHIESCCERWIRRCHICPACSKPLTTSISKKHLLVCANNLELDLPTLLTLGATDSSEEKIIARPRGKSGKIRRAEYLNTSKRIDIRSAYSDSSFKKKGIKSLHSITSTEHLLLDNKTRNKIFTERLEKILKISSSATLPRTLQPIEFENINAHLWELSSMSSCAAVSSSSISPEKPVHYYVSALVPPISPCNQRFSDKLLRMSQIPGHSPSNLNTVEACIENNSNILKDSTSLQNSTRDIEPSSQSSIFLHMVGKSFCSDLSIILDSGEEIPAHRFVFAAWNPDLDFLRETSNFISAPGINKEQLIHLLTSLYTSNFTALSSLEPQVEFVLDCWQLLEVVRPFSNSVQIENNTSVSRNTPISAKLNFTKEGNTFVASCQSPIKQTKLENKSPITSTASPIKACYPNPLLADTASTSIQSKSENYSAEDLAECSTVSMYPSTPSLSKHKPPQIEPMYSADLFTSPNSTCYPESPTHDDLIRSDHFKAVEDRKWEELDSNSSPQKKIPLQAPIDCLPLDSSSHDSYDDLSFSCPATPPPLIKRLRLNEESPTMCIGEIVGRVPGSVLHISAPSSPQHQPALLNLESDIYDEETSSSQQILRKISACLTPANSRISISGVSYSPITPKPNFDTLQTPDLKRALSEYGVRHLPKKKAIRLLNHIYDELHPYVDLPSISIEEEQKNDPSSIIPADKIKNTMTVNISCKSKDSILSSNALPFKTNTNHHKSSLQEFHVSANCRKTKEKEKTDLQRRVYDYLHNDDNLYYNIITYKVLDIESIHALLRDAGIKIGLNRLTKMLDEWGITYTSVSKRSHKA